MILYIKNIILANVYKKKIGEEALFLEKKAVIGGEVY